MSFLNVVHSNPFTLQAAQQACICVEHTPLWQTVIVQGLIKAEQAVLWTFNALESSIMRQYRPRKKPIES